MNIIPPYFVTNITSSIIKVEAVKPNDNTVHFWKS